MLAANDGLREEVSGVRTPMGSFFRNILASDCHNGSSPRRWKGEVWQCPLSVATVELANEQIRPRSLGTGDRDEGKY